LARVDEKSVSPRNGESLWRDEFSVFEQRERFVNRRQLVKFLTLTSVGMFAGNTWILIRSWFRREEKYPRQIIARVGEVPVGGVKLFRYPHPNEHCLLIRTAENDYVAYSQNVRIFPVPFTTRGQKIN
jgi:arsenite oxidase small subunit